MSGLTDRKLIADFIKKEQVNSDQLTETLAQQTLEQYVVDDYNNLSQKLVQDRAALESKGADDASYASRKADISQKNLKLKIALNAYDIKLNLVSFNELKKLNSFDNQGVVKEIYTKQLEKLSERNSKTFGEIEKLVEQIQKKSSKKYMQNNLKNYLKEILKH